MTRRHRIVFVIGSLREGGAEGQLLHLAHGLRSRGWRVSIMLLRSEGARLEAAQREGLPIFHVGLPRFRPLWNPVPWLRLLSCWRRSAQHLARERPHVLHAWLFWAHLWAWLILPAARGAAFVTSRRQTWSDVPASAPIRWIARRIDKASTLVIANARAVAEVAMAGNPAIRRKLRVIPNGIDLAAISAANAADLRAEFPSLRDCTTIAITVANLLPHKGYEDLIEAWRTVAIQHPDAGIVCIGADGGMQRDLQRRIDKFRLGKRVVLAGPRAEVIPLLKGADFAVHASRDEGFSNAVLEYLACGLAVVATRAGGTAEAVEDGVTGFLCPVASPAELALAIQRILESPSRRVMGARAAEEMRRRYPLARMVIRHERVYTTLVQKRKQR